MSLAVVREELQSAGAEEDLGIFEGLADMAMASVSLGAAVPTAIVGAIVVLASAVASRRGIAATSAGPDRRSPETSKEAGAQSPARPIVIALGAIGAFAAVLAAIWAAGVIGTGSDEGSEPIRGDFDPDDRGDLIEGLAPASPGGAVTDLEAPATSSMPRPQPMIVGIDQLIEAFDENEFRALEIYGNRHLQVTGVVESVEEIDRLFGVSIGRHRFRVQPPAHQGGGTG